MRIDRRSALRGALAAGVALPFLAGRAVAQAADTIRIWTFMSAEGASPREKVFKALIDDFQAKNKVKVVVEFSLPDSRPSSSPPSPRSERLTWYGCATLS